MIRNPNKKATARMSRKEFLIGKTMRMKMKRMVKVVITNKAKMLKVNNKLSNKVMLPDFMRVTFF